jgi:hypothetical protein
VFSAADSDALHTRVRAFIRASMRAEPTEPFDALALDLARAQAARIPAVSRLTYARHAHLPHHARAQPPGADAIPAVPCDVFRLARLAVHPASCDVALFRTSGTSQAARGEHALRTTETYELAALSWGERHLWPDGADLRALVLAPPFAEAPDSSLGFMLDRFAHALRGRPAFLVHRGAPGEAAIDVDGVARAAAVARAEHAPVIVLATSFALVHLLDAAGDRALALPEGSRIMQTGGFKGRSREIAPDALRAMLSRVFAVPETHVVGEYGMTELSSQLYEGTLAAALGRGPAMPHGVFAPPPWVRVTAVDPETLLPVPAGEIGIARIVDLANVDSAVAIQTADRVRAVDGGVELLGRLPGATPRGCSIAADEMLGGA